MQTFCEVYEIKDNGVLVHRGVMLNNREEKANLEHIINNNTFEHNSIYVAIFLEPENDSFAVSNVLTSLPVLVNSYNIPKLMAIIGRLKKMHSKERITYAILNLKSLSDIYDFEYLDFNQNAILNYQEALKTFYAEKLGVLKPEQEKMLKEYRTFNLEKFLFTNPTQEAISNKNSGLIILTPDKVYELPETHTYHYVSSQVGLSRHYNDPTYMHIWVDKQALKGNVIISINPLELLVYRSASLNAFQKKYLSDLQTKIINLEQTHKQKIENEGTFIYTYNNVPGIISFFDKQAINSLTETEVKELIAETNKNYYEPITVQHK